MEHYSILDLILVPFFGVLILLVAKMYEKRQVTSKPYYRYFTLGLGAKMLGAIGLCLVYTLYYQGGDTVGYHVSAKAVVNVLVEKGWGDFLSVWLGDTNKENFSIFTHETGLPLYWSDTHAYTVVRIITPLEIIGFQRFLVTAMLVATLSFVGFWKLYRLFCELYPSLIKKMAIAVLFIPSVVFWGSGILKDTICFSAACWFTYSIYRLFITRTKIIYVVPLIIVSLVMVAIKPYIIVALFPSTLIWVLWDRVLGIKNRILRTLAAPMLIVIGTGLGVGAWTAVGSALGDYGSIDTMIEQARVKNIDQQQAYYKGNSFNIGDYDATVAGVLSVFPQATIAGIFRPFIWEARNPVMLLSGLENLIILGFSIYTIAVCRWGIFRIMISNPETLFCLIFAIMFGYSVGLSTSNFGTLVRLKIPLFPYFFGAFFIILEQHNRSKLTGN